MKTENVMFAYGMATVAQPQNSGRWCTIPDEMTIVFLHQAAECWPVQAFRWVSVDLYEVSTEDLEAAGALFKKHRRNLMIRTAKESLTLGNKRQKEVSEQLTEDGQAVYLALLHRYQAQG